MYALTLKHPWAYAIVRLGKRIENRTWEPPQSLIGQWVAIHGGAIPTGSARAEAQADMAWMVEKRLAPRRSLLGDMILPGVVGLARLDRVITAQDTRDPLHGNAWFFGPYGLVISEVVELPEPVPCRGKLGFWPLPHDVLVEVRRRYRDVVPKGGMA